MSESERCTIQLLIWDCPNPPIFRCTAQVGDTRQKPRIEERLGCRKCAWAWAMEGGVIEPIEGWPERLAVWLRSQGEQHGQINPASAFGQERIGGDNGGRNGNGNDKDPEHGSNPGRARR